MSITTQAIRLTPNVLFDIAIRRHFADRKWQLFAYPFGLVAYLFLSQVDYEIIRFLGMAGFMVMVIFLAYTLVFYWQRTHQNAPPALFLSRHYIIDNLSINTRVENGATRSNRWDSIVQLTETARYFVLYTSRTQFMYISKKAFKSAEDLAAFGKMLKDKGIK